MLKTISLFGLIAMTALAAVFFVGTPATGRLAAREKPREAHCATVEAAIDEGYGVTRNAPRTVCGK